MNKLILFFGLVAAHCVYCQSSQVDYLLTNVSIIPMNTETVLKNKDLTIKDGKIISITDTNKGKFKATEKIDCKGKFIMPTLVDAHVHLPKVETELENILTLNLINGVTRLRSMRGDAKHVDWKKKYNTINSFYPKMYLSTPPVYSNQDFTSSQLENLVKNVHSNGFDFIKILGVKNQTIFTELDRFCKENKVKMAGHFPNDPTDVIIADDIIFNSNLNSIEHLGGLIGEPLTLESRIKAMKEKNVFSCPTLRWYEIAYGEFDLNEVQNQKGIQYITPTLVAQWVDKTVNYREKMGEKPLKEELDFYAKEIIERLNVIKRLNDAGVKLLISPDSSSKFIIPGFGIITEMNLYKKAGLSNYDILKSATVNYSSYIDDDSFGTIAVGKKADFLILNENPLLKIDALEKIDGIFFNSNYLTKSKLEELANAALPAKK